MQKSDLKIGYLVECRNGVKKMLMPNEYRTVLVSKDGFYYDLNSLKDDLTTDFDEDFDIMKVYGLSKFSTEVLTFDIDHRDLLWEREKSKKEMTISEIEKELGYSIKIIKED